MARLLDALPTSALASSDRVGNAFGIRAGATKSAALLPTLRHQKIPKPFALHAVHVVGSVDVPQRWQLAACEARARHADARLRHDPVGAPGHAGKQNLVRAVHADQHIAAVLGWNDDRVV